MSRRPSFSPSTVYKLSLYGIPGVGGGEGGAYRIRPAWGGGRGGVGPTPIGPLSVCGEGEEAGGFSAMPEAVFLTLQQKLTCLQ